MSRSILHRGWLYASASGLDLPGDACGRWAYPPSRTFVGSTSNMFRHYLLNRVFNSTYPIEAHPMAALKSVKEIMLALILANVIVASAMATSAPAQAEASTAAPSASGASLPPVQSQGQTEFVTGGIGLDESEAIKKEGRSWPLMLEFAQASAPHPEYIGDVKITVKDKSGNVVLDATGEGPYMLIKLAPGKYSLDATYASVTLHRDLKLEKGQNRKITLLWPLPETRTKE